MSRRGSVRPGCFEIWSTIRPQEVDPSPAFSPLDEVEVTSPVKQLAARIADLIDGWLKNHEELTSQGRPIKASDIIILVRKRQPFAPEMVRALKARGIPVAGAGSHSTDRSDCHP